MNSLQLKKAEIEIRTKYAVVRELGVYQPDAKGRTILTRDELIGLFNYETEPRRLLGLAQWLTGTHLENMLANENYVADDRSHIVNQHFNFAQTVLLHHKKLYGPVYQEKLDIFERMRGEFLRQVAELADATVTNSTEYAYWLSGYAEKFIESDPVKYGHFKQDAETVLRQVHAIGHIEATEALATLLYVDRDERNEAISLWEQAAAAGNVNAINNLSNVVMGDDSFTHEERNHSLMAVWQGIVSNPNQTRDIAKTLKRAGYIALLPNSEIPAPA